MTPVYNRVSMLPRLYESLLAQESERIAWYLIDDGSSDGTWNAMLELASAAPFPVHCLRKSNGGKHTAINLALAKVAEELLFIVDSDDTLPKTSVATILRSFDEIGAIDGICGISFLKEMSNDSKSAIFSQSWLRGTYVDVRVNGNVIGDKAEVFYTEVLKRYRFPEYPGERFYHEDGLWVEISKEYEMYHLNEVVYEGSYLTDGLTANGREMKVKSPLGMMHRSSEFLRYPGHVRARVLAKHALLWDVYYGIANKNSRPNFRRSPSPILCGALWIPARIVRRNWIGHVNDD